MLKLDYHSIVYFLYTWQPCNIKIACFDKINCDNVECINEKIGMLKEHIYHYT